MRKRIKIALIPIVIVSLGLGYAGAYAAQHTFFKPAQPTPFAQSSKAVKADAVGPCDDEASCYLATKSALPQLQQITDLIIKTRFEGDPKNLARLHITETVYNNGNSPDEVRESYKSDDGATYSVPIPYDTAAFKDLQQKKWFVGLKEQDGQTDSSSNSIRKQADKIVFDSLIAKIPSAGFCSAYDYVFSAYYSLNAKPISDSDRRVDSTHWYFSIQRPQDHCASAYRSASRSITD